MKSIQPLAKNRVIIFTTDQGFLLPTISAVLQLCKQADVIRIADIIIYLVDMAEESRIELKKAFAGFPIVFISIPPELTKIPKDVIFNKTHVPHSTLVRLSTGSLIPTQYTHVVYLDGDIQILGDLLPMVSYNVPKEKIGAASDSSWLYSGDIGGHWKFTKNYLNGLGISDPRDYFNAGVLLFRRETWVKYAPAAWDFYIKNSGRCSFHDQSALNAVFLGRREIVSPLYNFVSGYSDLGAHFFYPPKIIHFTGAGKPWCSYSWPWRGKFISEYEEILCRFPLLEKFYRRKTPEEIEKIDKHAKAMLRKSLIRTPWRIIYRNQKFSGYMRETKFVF